MSCGYDCEYNCEECDRPSEIIEYIKGYNQALDDISEKIKWQYKNYKSMPSIHLFLEIVEELKK